MRAQIAALPPAGTYGFVSYLGPAIAGGRLPALGAGGADRRATAPSPGGFHRHLAPGRGTAQRRAGDRAHERPDHRQELSRSRRGDQLRDPALPSTSRRRRARSSMRGYPAPCGGLNEVRFARGRRGHGERLRKLIPERLTGDVRGTSNHTYIGGRDTRRNRSFIFYEYPSGGTGGSARQATAITRCAPSTRARTSRSNRARSSSRSFRCECGGGGPAGQRRTGPLRGGCGFLREVEVMTEDGVSRCFPIATLFRRRRPWRRAGAPNRFRSGARERPWNWGISRQGRQPEAATGDVVRMLSSGGGGFGDPSERAPAELQADLADGYVTEAGRAAYERAAPASLVQRRGRPRVRPVPPVAPAGHGRGRGRGRSHRGLARA